MLTRLDDIIIKQTQQRRMLLHPEFEHNAAGPRAASLWIPASLGLLRFACQNAGLIPPA